MNCKWLTVVALGTALAAAACVGTFSVAQSPLPATAPLATKPKFEILSTFATTDDTPPEQITLIEAEVPWDGKEATDADATAPPPPKGALMVSNANIIFALITTPVANNFT